MPGTIGTIFFQDYTSYSNAGWSESHLLINATLDLPAALARLRILALRRSTLLAQGIGVTYFRVSKNDIFRDSQITPGLPPLLIAQLPVGVAPGAGQPVSGDSPGPAFQIGNPLFPNDPADMPWTAILVRGEGGAPYTARSMFWLAGLPDNLTFSQQRGITDANWVAQFNLWKAVMIAEWGFMGQDSSINNPNKPIQNAAVVAGQVVITSNGHGFATGQMVRVATVKTVNKVGKYVNGVWQIIVQDANNFILLGTVAPAPFTYLAGGYAVLQRKVPIPYAALIQRKFGSRKRGRPFGQLIGRRRVRKSA